MKATDLSDPIQPLPISEEARDLADLFHQVFVLGGNPFSRIGARPLIGLTVVEKRDMIQSAINAAILRDRASRETETSNPS